MAVREQPAAEIIEAMARDAIRTLERLQDAREQNA
jgi:hypothetical protein